MPKNWRGGRAVWEGIEQKKYKMASTTFENKLNAAIEEKGYRISPRLSLEDRLARYIELTWIDRGEPLTSEEITAVVALTMVNTFGVSWGSADSWRSTDSWRFAEGADWSESESQEPRRSARVASRQTQSSTDDSEDTWQPRRSARVASRDTWEPRRSSRIAASSRNVTATNDSVRVSFVTGAQSAGAQSAGAHPMVRRSQVVRR
jgi:hypothetical protein